MARLVRLICVWTGVALAVWLLPASIHIVDWTADGPVRVALLAPLWRLWAALEAPGRFRPSDCDPGSTDRRWLGCQVRVALR